MTINPIKIYKRLKFSQEMKRRKEAEYHERVGGCPGCWGHARHMEYMERSPSIYLAMISLSWSLGPCKSLGKRIDDVLEKIR